MKESATIPYVSKQKNMGQQRHEDVQMDTHRGYTQIKKRQAHKLYQ